MANTVEMMSCASCDLLARLRSELVLARNELRALESKFVLAGRWDDVDTLPPPHELRRALAEQRLHVESIEQVLADLHCDHAGEPIDAAA